MSISPAIVPSDVTAGVPATGAGSSLPSRTMRSRPCRSVMRMAPSGKEREAPRMRQPLGDDHRAKAALLVAVEQERAVAERRAVPRPDARARGNRAALIADGRIGILALGLRNGHDTGQQHRTRHERNDASHDNLTT